MCDTPSPLPPCAPTAVTSGRSHGGDFAPSASLFLSVSRALRTAGSLTLSRRTTRTCAAHPSCVIGCVSRRPRRQDAESPALCLRSSPSCELRAGWGGSWAPCGMDGSWAPEPRRVEHGLLQGMEHVLLGRAPWLQPPQLPALPGPQTCFPGGGLPFFLSVFFLTPFPLLLPPPVSVLTFGVCGSIPPPPPRTPWGSGCPWMAPSCSGPYDALRWEHGYKEMQLQPAGVVLLAGDTVSAMWER